MGNVATYQVKIIFNDRKRFEWKQDHSLLDTINYLRGNNWSYEVPIVICPNYTYFQFGEKYSLFEDLSPKEAQEELINKIWEKDNKNCIQKIYYRSSEDSGRNDTIFSSVKGELSVERYCRYGFDEIKFKLLEGQEINDQEFKSLNIKDNSINLNGSYLNQNSRCQIVSLEELLKDKFLDKETVYQTLTSFTMSRSHFPESFQPARLNDELKLFFKSCEQVEFKWKGRTTLKLKNKSNDIFEDWFEAMSNDYWDNVVDIEYYKDHNDSLNTWNENSNLSNEPYLR